MGWDWADGFGFALIIITGQIKQIMEKNSLINILFERKTQRDSAKKLAMESDNKQKINTKKQIPQHLMQGINHSNQMIKITQFNSSLIINDERLQPRDYRTSYSNSPQKNFNIKKISELKTKVTHNAQKIIDIQLKKKDKYLLPNGKQTSYLNELNRSQQVQKLMITSKWSIKNQITNLDIANSISSSQCAVLIFKNTAEQMDKNIKVLELNQQIVFGKSKELIPSKQVKMGSSKERNRPSILPDCILTSVDSQTLGRKLSASPRKNYSKQINQQKKYQQIAEREKKDILQMKKELNKNYAKPFNPPENITAFSYVIYEADAKRTNSKKLRKYSAKRQDIAQLTQNRKLFLHSHQVIVSLNSRTAVEMASLTKIMTCIIALDLSKLYKLNLDNQLVTIGLFQQNIGGTSANIKKGQIYSIYQLLHGLMLPSGNDASLAIAVWGGRLLLAKQSKKDVQSSSISTATNIGDQKSKLSFKKRQSVQRFIVQMNNKAGELNMEKTKYANSHGLSNPQNRSCAYDLSVLCEYAMNYKEFREIVACKMFQGEIKIQSQEPLSSKMPGKQNMRESKKSLKKKVSMSLNKQGILQMQEMKDMDLMVQNYAQQQQDNEHQQAKTMQVRSIKWQNTHQLLQQKSELYIGIKTGVTNTAGPCLASCIQIKGRRFIIVVLNCKNMKYRMKDTQNLRKWLFNKEGIKYAEVPTQQEEENV